MIDLRKTIGFIIAPLKRDFIRIYEALKSFGTLIIFIDDRLTSINTVVKNWTFTIHLFGEQIVGTDVGDFRYQVRLPLNALNNAITRGVRLHLITVSAKVASATGDYVADLLVSKDLGVTYQSIFPDAAADKVVLPQDAIMNRFTKFATSTLQDGWNLRVDIITADGICSGVEIMIRGELITT